MPLDRKKIQHRENLPIPGKSPQDVNTNEFQYAGKIKLEAESKDLEKKCQSLLHKAFTRYGFATKVQFDDIKHREHNEFN